MPASTAIIGGGMVGNAIARLLAAAGEEPVVVKQVRPADNLAFAPGTGRVVLTAQSHDSQSAVVTEDLAFVNTGLVVKALAAAERAGVEEVCLFSTGSVYRAAPRPLREDDPVETALAPYVATKLAAEMYARSWAPRFRRLVILRPFMIYGEGLGAERLLARLPMMARAGRTITLAGGKGLVTNPIHAEDAARCTLSLLRGSGFAIYNLGGKEVASLAEIVALMAETLALQPMLAVSDAPALQLVGDIGAMLATGAAPTIDLRDGLRRYYQGAA